MHAIETAVVAAGPLNLLLWLSGILIVLVAVRLLTLSGTWDETAKYEALGLEPPQKATPGPGGSGRRSISLEERICRLGAGLTVIYVAATFPGGTGVYEAAATAIGLYVVWTGLAGREPLYRLFSRLKGGERDA